MSDDNKCSHCGQMISQENNEDVLVERIKKKAVAEVMQTIQPLLNKLQELGTQQETVNTAAIKPMSHEELLKNLQASALDRIKLKENSLAVRMKKLQGRMSTPKNNN